MITAQLFRSRRRSNSTHEPVSQAQILQILDSLKRRVRQQEQLLRRPSEIDPETESEDDPGPLDEREEEFEGLREELANERAQREEWLEDAEARVDGLMGEKEELGKALEGREGEVEELRGKLEEVEESLKKNQREYEEKIKGLEEEKERSAGEMERLRREKDEGGALSKRKQEELQERYDKLDKEQSTSNSTMEELRRGAASDAEERSGLKHQLEQHKQSLEDARRDVELHGKELKQLLGEHERMKVDFAAVQQEHDNLKAQHDTLTKDSAASSDRAKQDLGRARAEHEEKSRSLNDEHERQTAESNTKYDELQAKFVSVSKEKDELEAKMEARMRDLRAEHENILKSSTDENASQVGVAKRELDDLQPRYDKLVVERDQQAATAEGHLRDVKAEHRTAFNKSLLEHEERQRNLSAEVNDLKQAKVEAEKTRQAYQDEIDGLKAQVSGSQREREQAESSLKAQVSELEGKIRESESGLASLTQQKTAFEQRALDAESSKSSREAELNSKIAQKENDLGTIRTRVAELEAEVQNLLSDLAKKDGELSDVTKRHEQRVRDVEADWSAKADEAAKTHQAEMQASSHAASRARDDLQRQLEERETSAEAKALSAREDGAKELDKATADLKAQLAAAQDALVFGKRELDSARAGHEDALTKLRSDHESRVSEMQATFDKRQREAKEGFEAQLAAAATASTARSADLESQRERALSDSSSKYQAELASLRATHEEASNEMLRKVSALETRLERTGTDHAQTLSDKEELEYKISQLKSSHEQALSRLSSEHEEALAASVARSEQHVEEQLHVQAQVHSDEFDRLQENLNGELQNLQIQLEEAAELRHSQMQAADDRREKALGELNEKLSSAEETAAALQGRLDMELTSRAEVERSLAELRRQRLEDEKRSTEQLEKMQYELASLQIERDALSRRATVLSDSMDKDLANGTSDGITDVTVLKRKLAAAEAELSEIRRSNDQSKTAGGDSELARQNEFLASQLQAMIATRSTPTTPVVERSDAEAQTEPIPEEKAQRQQQDQPVVRQITIPKQQRSDPRPITPKTPQQVTSQRSSDRAWKTRSFEDYLQQAHAELSELGSVISQNEALFAQKIQEHVGDLQRAKDQLAAEYKEKFDSLLAGRQKLEKDISAKSAEEFARERQELVEKYGAYHDEPAKQAAAITNLSTPKRNALRSAEQQLVTQYNQRVVKRKSQVALKHAEDFQSLTQDYDRRLAELLGNRDKLGADLSVEPDQFEKDFGALEVMSAKLESERGDVNGAAPQQQGQDPPVEDAIAGAVHDARTTKVQQPVEKPSYAPKSQLPKRSLTSTPRTPTSIPRAMPFAGRHSSVDYSQKRQSMDRLPHIRQQSAMPAQCPIEEISSPAVASSKTKSAHRISIQPVNNTPAAQDFGIEPAEFEERATQQEKSRLSPELQRANFNKRRSMRLSSGIMYSGWQAPRDL